MALLYDDEERAARLRRIRRAEYARRRRDYRGRFLCNFSAVPRDRYLTIRLTEPEEAAIRDLAAARGTTLTATVLAAVRALGRREGRVKGGRVSGHLRSP